MIPKVIHRIWLGSPMPAPYQIFGEKWEKLHPGWSIKTWGDDDLAWLQNRDLYDRAEEFVPKDAIWQYKSDLARYEILSRWGGLYVDCDSEPLKNHDPLMDAEIFAGWEIEGSFVANGVIGTIPDHPVMKEMISVSRDMSVKHRGRAATWLSGPRAFTPVITAYKGATIHPKNYFYPYLYDEIKKGLEPEKKDYNGSYSVHHWNHRRELKNRPLSSQNENTLSVSIMAHKKREAWVPLLSEQLPQAKVIWDQKNDRWDTGARSLMAYDPDAKWHMVVQDDAILPPDFYEGVQRMLTFVPPRNPVGLYYGRVRPRDAETRALVIKANREDAPFIIHNGPWWGVGIVIPTRQIQELVDWGNNRPDVANYDRRIARFYLQKGIDCYYTNPSLIQHRTDGNPSLVPGRTGQNRRAWNFVGPQSALSVDWSGDPVRSKM